MDHAGDHSPNGNLVILSKADVRVIWVLRLQHGTPSLNLLTLHRELPVDASDDNLVLVVGRPQSTTSISPSLMPAPIIE